MGGEIKFGEKDFGRSPVERLIIIMEKNSILRPIINLLFLIILIGVNSQVHEDTTKGIQFLLLVFLILYSGNEATTNFFGAATLPIFLIIHLSMFGFNALALIITFIIFLFFQDTLKRNFLGPITIYLTIDTFFIFWGLNISGVFYKLSLILFSTDVYILLSIIPASYLFIFVDRVIKINTKKDITKKYGVFMVFGIFFMVSFLLGTILVNQILIYISLSFLLLYFLGYLLYYNNKIKTLVIFILPIAVFLIIVYIIKMKYYL